MKITVQTTVAATMEDVWRAWVTPEDIKQWNAASDDWHTTAATVDLRVGGAFTSRMEAKDGSVGFDFAGTYTRIVPHERIEFAFGDRTAVVEFIPKDGAVLVRESFDAEETHSPEQQKQGWQAILDRFARHAASSGATFRTRRQIAASPSEVFAAFSHAERLALWWGPNGFRNTFKTFEFVPGGRWVFVMHGPNGIDYPNESMFRVVEADSRIVVEHVCQPRYTLTVTLSAAGEETVVSWVQVFEEAKVAQRLRHIVEPGNEQNLDRLQALLARAGG